MLIPKLFTNDLYVLYRVCVQLYELLICQKGRELLILLKEGSYTIQSQAITYNSRIIKTNVLVNTKFLGQFKPFKSWFSITITSNNISSRSIWLIYTPKSPPKTFKDFINTVFAKMNCEKIRVFVQMVVFWGVYGKLLL